MERISVTQNNAYMCDLWVTESMKKLANQFNNINFAVSLIPAGYSATNEECRGGDFGYMGSVPHFGPGTKQKFPEQTETIVCTVKLSLDVSELLGEIKNLSSELYVRPGGRNNKLEPLTIKSIDAYSRVDKQFYICKNPGFDDVYDKLKVLIPDLEEIDLINMEIRNVSVLSYKHGKSYNPAFVHIAEDSDSYLTTFGYSYNENIGISHYDFKLEIIASDIDRNHDMIVKILQMISDYVV